MYFQNGVITILITAFQNGVITILITAFFLAPNYVSSARILGFFPIPSYSHQIVYRAYMQELAHRGHDITIITPDPTNEPSDNYREIDISYGYDFWRKNVDIASDSASGWLIRNIPEFFFGFFTYLSNDFCEMYLSHPEVKQLISDREQFDAFVVEFTSILCPFPLALQSNNIMIGIFSLAMLNSVHFHYGSTANPAYVPDIILPYSDNMNIFQRVRALIFQLAMEVVNILAAYSQQSIAEKHFGAGIPKLLDLQNNASLFFEHTHFSTAYPRPLSPMFINIGGPPLHLAGVKGKPLPQDLKEFLDGAAEGVIYFSLGTNVKSSTMPESKRVLFLNAFRQIKQKVLWKWETDSLPGKPDNVKLYKWLPQTDVLAHANVRAFITQGGLQSTGEATHFTVPMVIIPFFADQEKNAKKLQSVGASITLDLETLTEEGILRAVTDIIRDPKYKENMVKYSELTRDQPQTPMETAVWWTEYVLRHNGAQHLRTAAVDMPWYQYLLLDVLAFLAAVLAAILYILHFIFSRLLRLIFRRFKKKTE